VLHRDRSFFGVMSVDVETDERTSPPTVYHKLVHGTTLHGKQQVDPPSDAPLTYYHRTGPIGQVFAAGLPAVTKGELAFVGLGTGTMSAYAGPGQKVTFYEIDPKVKRIAEDPRYFTYLRDCKGPYEIVMGDARLKLEEHGRPNQYGLIVVDAFSSDAIPVHLLTQEAVGLYRSRLAPGGLIALHISNRYLNLEPVAARIAQELGLSAISEWDSEDLSIGRQGSQWVLLAAKPEDFGSLPTLTADEEVNGRTVPKRRWEELKAKPGDPLWRDDFSNLLEIFMWDKIFKVRK